MVVRTAETIQIKSHQCLDKSQLVVQICTVQTRVSPVTVEPSEMS